jgi:hypothetical protein
MFIQLTGALVFMVFNATFNNISVALAILFCVVET